MRKMDLALRRGDIRRRMSYDVVLSCVAVDLVNSTKVDDDDDGRVQMSIASRRCR